jgi:4,5-DOPA dioxygenase extradiol
LKNRRFLWHLDEAYAMIKKMEEVAMNKMPVLFIGHGSPMNVIEDNQYTDNWEAVAKRLPKPKAILCISAHWYTHGTRVNTEKTPRTIYDMYGFPKPLYEIVYPAQGDPELAKRVSELLGERAKVDNQWGFDHGSWSVLHRMYPKADIPLVQLSIDGDAPAEVHYQIGKALEPLRDEGVLIFGSGNVVHNLSRMNWSMAGGYDWAETFDRYVADRVKARRFDDVVNYKKAGPSAEMAFYTPEHYYPLLYVLGAANETDAIEVFNDDCIMGAISMTCYLIG